jgi:SPP1 gp7 family putative phage head morphogenesis protein
MSITWLHPDAIAKAYDRALQQHIANVWIETIEEMIFPLLQTFIDDLRLDSFMDDKFEQLKFRINVKSAIHARKLAEKYANDINKFNAKQCLKVVKLLPLDRLIPNFDKAMHNFVTENVRLINGLQEETIRLLAQRITSGVRKGYTVAQLQKSIQYRFGIDKGVFKTIKARMSLIALDQVGKLNGQLTRLRQTALGIVKYIWRTREDSRVRPAHRLRNGKSFRWASSPADGHPGEAIRCRCWAEPIITDKKKALTK